MLLLERPTKSGLSPTLHVALRGLEEDGAPLILEREEGDFVQALLDDFGRGLDALRAKRAVDRALVKTKGGQRSTLKLYHPAANVTHIALFELYCAESPYAPRLDPRKLLDASLVIRKVAGGLSHRWGSDSLGARGWFPITSAEQELAWPDPQGRPPRFRTGDPALDRMLADLDGDPAFEETSSPLFLAPPDLCEALGRTVLWGVVPTASREICQAPAPFANALALRSHIPSWLRSLPRTQDVPFAGKELAFAQITTADDAAEQIPLLLPFVAMLRQLVFEFGLLEAQPSAAQRSLRTALAAVPLRFLRDATIFEQSALHFLTHAASVLVTRSEASVLMPVEWQPLNTQIGAAIEEAVAAIVQDRRAAVRPQEARYAHPQSRYTLRAFARVQHDADCPAEIVTGEESEPFVIAPWYEGKAPGVPIQLPPLDMNLLKSLKPNAAFAVPGELQALLNGKEPNEMLEGKFGQSGIGVGVAWICSFSIPVITLCAFIVLNIFLGLLNIVFKWMAWFKICIPVPIPTVEEE